MLFAQFVCTYVPLWVAVKLVGGDSAKLRRIAEGEDFLLPTFAKLGYSTEESSFYIFSYHYNGNDGRDAVLDIIDFSDTNTLWRWPFTKMSGQEFVDALEVEVHSVIIPDPVS